MSIYLTAILPPPALAAEIDDLRREVSERFKVYKALKPPIHITLFKPVKLNENLEEHLLRLLRPLTLHHTPFDQTLENFDSFNDKTFFIKVSKTSALLALQKDISSVFRKNKIDEGIVKERNSFSPHITLAYRDVSPDTFKAIWQEYKSKKFKRAFTTDRFAILKHDGNRWNIFEEIPLEKPAVLELF